MPPLQKLVHEVRCPIHGFIRFDALERRIIDSRPVQRLKHIHQLAMTHQLYPGATHRRFEHSLGVMDLAGRAFDSLMQPGKRDYAAPTLPEVGDEQQRAYWRRVLRLSALLHDTGHLPFSHAAETELLPQGRNHESLTWKVVVDSEVAGILQAATPPVRPEDVAKIAIAPSHLPKGQTLTPWEAIVNDIITHPVFGVDRIDYLLRDSHHAGVGYGRFDPLRLLDSFVIVRRPTRETVSETGLRGEHPEELVIGLEHGGLHGGESLLLARYFIWMQVYLHHVRRAYDIHLKDFMVAWLGDDRYPMEVEEHLRLTDEEVSAAIRVAATSRHSPGAAPARRIEARNHFRLASRLRKDNFAVSRGVSPDIQLELARALEDQYGAEQVRLDAYEAGSGAEEVFVVLDNGDVEDARQHSDVLEHIPRA